MSTIVNSTTFTVAPVGYDGLQLTWTVPVGTYNEQILLRSAFGTPLSVFAGNGTVLLDQLVSSGTQSTTFTDTGLRPGHFYYYSLIVFNQALGEYVVAGSAQGLVISYFGFGETFTTWMPDWYLEQDALIPSNPLVSYLTLIGYEMDWVRSEIESLFLFTNINLVSGALLPALGANFGMSYEPELGMTRSRVLVGNAVYLYKNRGTQIGVAAAASGFSGYGCVVTEGINLEIQLDDAAFDSPYSPSTTSYRHWVGANGTSIIKAVPAAAVSVTPQHATYNPAAVIVPALTSALTNGLPYTTLPVTELQQAINTGDSIQLVSNGRSQTYIASAPEAAGSFSIAVTSQNANYAYPVGATVQDLTSGFVTAGYLPVNNENVGQFGSNGAIAQFSTCTEATATTLGIPVTQQATPPSYVLSAYFQPDSQTTPTLRSFRMQIDWYGVTGALISSTIGSAVAEVSGQWVRAYVVGSPPGGAYYFGRTFLSTAALGADVHLIDAEQVEVNTQATPGPSSWQPPRDIRVNMAPFRQNLFVNPVGRSGTFSWSISGGSLVPTSTTSVAWPAETSSGFIIEAATINISGLPDGDYFGAITPGMSWFGGAVVGGIQSATPQTGNITVSSSIPVTGGLAYSLSVYMQAATMARTIQLSVAYYNAQGSLVSPTVFAGTLNQALVAGQTYTTLPISPLPFGVNANESIVINIGGLTQQLVQTSAAAQIGTSLLPVNSFIANASYPAGTVIVFSYITFTDTVGKFTRGSSINLITPLTATTAVVQITVIGPASFEAHYLAAPLFEPLPNLLPYFDANFLPVGDYLWEGVPNESISDYYPALSSKLSRLITVLPSYTPIGSTFSLITGPVAAAVVAAAQ